MSDEDNSIIDSFGSKQDKISFPMVLMIHLNRISGIRTSLTTAENVDERIWSLMNAVDCLEDLLAPYYDDAFEEDMKTIDGIIKQAEETQISGTELYVVHKDIAMHYARKKLRFLMKLIGRRNLLLNEDVGIEVG